MIINNNDTADVSRASLEQTSLSKTQGSARTGASNPASASGAPGDDSITLSNSPNLVQQALSSSNSARSARTQELKALVANNQYQPDAQEVSSALIDAHLSGA
jgi:anti-sigma28 factor (negative regulator of flagellin synthesis)